jgi:predicted dehydrogenase
MEKINVAIIGCGIGREHAAAYTSLADRFQIVAVCDQDQAKARAVAEQFGVPQVCADIAEACALSDADVIDICTPSFLHFEQTRLALTAGKSVLCEKPIAGSLAEVDALLALESKSRGRVIPIFQYRFGNGLQQLRWLMGQGIAGRAFLATAEVAWRRRADYYAGSWRGKRESELGGALVTHAIHALDILLYVLGPVERVLARTATRVNSIEVEDCAVVSLELCDGALASLALTLGSSAQISRHRFCFANLTAESNTEPYSNTREPWKFTGDSAELDTRIAETLAHFEPRPQGFAGQFARLHDAWTRGTALPVTLAEARAVIELLTASYMSARTGLQVSLPIPESHPAYARWDA